jgi:hypothetical protein
MTSLLCAFTAQLLSQLGPMGMNMARDQTLLEKLNQQFSEIKHVKFANSQRAHIFRAGQPAR